MFLNPTKSKIQICGLYELEYVPFFGKMSSNYGVASEEQSKMSLASSHSQLNRFRD